MKLLITGGAGFIGSAVVRHAILDRGWTVANLDCLTYAANLASLDPVSADPRYCFRQVDIGDAMAVEAAIGDFQPDAILHLAAETHVDRSIDGPSAFLETNITGTYRMLEAARRYYQGLPAARRKRFRFHHVSTDEVYGALELDAAAFREDHPYRPSSPYAASKAASDHLVLAWHRTYGLPVLITNCSNNYGPCQFPEKLIPRMILTALRGEPLPVYGDGLQMRDWLHVEDHARALALVAEEGRVGETYNIGGNAELRNIDVVEAICALLDRMAPMPGGKRHAELITHVRDRPGHDFRYAIDAAKIGRELGWAPRQSFGSGLEQTVRWYLDNSRWWQPIIDGRYRLERLGGGE